MEPVNAKDDFVSTAVVVENGATTATEHEAAAASTIVTATREEEQALAGLCSTVDNPDAQGHPRAILGAAKDQTADDFGKGELDANKMQGIADAIQELEQQQAATVAVVTENSTGKIRTTTSGATTGNAMGSAMANNPPVALWLAPLPPPPPLDRNRRRLPTPDEPGAYAVPSRAAFVEPRPTTVAVPPIRETLHASINEGAPLDAALVESQHNSLLYLAQAQPNQEPSHTMRSTDDHEQPRRQEEDVESSSSLSLVQAQVLPEQTPSEQRTNHHLVLIGLVAVAMLAILLGLVLGTGNSSGGSNVNNSTSTMATTAPTAPIYYPPFQTDLPATTLKAIANDTTSDQYRANAWMWNDPYLDSYSKDRQLQRFALVTFYHGTKGYNWTNNDHWLDYETSECEWFTQSLEPICDDDSHIIKVDLHHNNLAGTIPIESQYIPYIQHSDLSYNRISGGTPNFVTNDKLQVLKISHNLFAGPLAGQAGFSAFNLRVIEMDGNAFHGYIAPIYQFLPLLQRINLTSNHFTGTLPIELQYATGLVYAGLGDNLYTGTIPTEIGRLTALESLDISGMKGIYGTVPSEIANMKSLQVLDVSNTSITGAIPARVCELIYNQTIQFMADCNNADDFECCGTNRTDTTS